MTPHQILIVGIRLLAIIWLLHVIGQSAAAVAAVQHLGGATVPIWISEACQLLACVFLWFFPGTLARRLLRAGNETVLAGSVPFDEWRDLAFVTVGVFMLARSVPTAIYWLILAGSTELFAPDFTLEQKASVLATVLELAIGVGLILGARGLNRLIQQVRGVRTASDRNEA